MTRLVRLVLSAALIAASVRYAGRGSFVMLSVVLALVTLALEAAFEAIGRAVIAIVELRGAVKDLLERMEQAEARRRE